MVTAHEVLRGEIFLSDQFVPSLSGESFTVLNPATNQPLAEVAKAGLADVERAVATARRAFDEGPWPRLSAYERGRVVQRIADRIRERA